jgi:hypothetical protein
VSPHANAGPHWDEDRHVVGNHFHPRDELMRVKKAGRAKNIRRVGKEPRAAAKTSLETVSRCLLCGYSAVDAVVDGRFVTMSCPACRAVLAIEFDPPDQPELRARIERINDPE